MNDSSTTARGFYRVGHKQGRLTSWYQPERIDALHVGDIGLLAGKVQLVSEGQQTPYHFTDVTDRWLDAELAEADDLAATMDDASWRMQ